MDQVNMRDARRRFSQIVTAAQRGRSTVITRRGRQVARVAPMPAPAGSPLPDLTEFRASITVKGPPLSKVVVGQREKARY
jgi:prevent-host-death family protein